MRGGSVMYGLSTKQMVEEVVVVVVAPQRSAVPI